MLAWHLAMVLRDGMRVAECYGVEYLVLSNGHYLASVRNGVRLLTRHHVCSTASIQDPRVQNQ